MSLNPKDYNSFFPLLIRFTDSDGTTVVKTAEDIPPGRAYHVIKTNYEEDHGTAFASSD